MGRSLGRSIENITHHQDRRVDVNVSVSFAADIEHTRKVLTEAARSVAGRLEDRPVEVNIAQLSASSVDWTVVVWTEAAEAGPAKQALLQKIKEGLDLAGVETPVPRMVPATQGRGSRLRAGRGRLARPPRRTSVPGMLHAAGGKGG